MLNTILKLGVFLVVGILAWNYFMGSPSEKASSQKIINEVKDLGAATWGLLKSEKEKFDEGKYNDALDKMGSLYDNLRGKADKLGSEVSDRVEDLDKQRKEISQQLSDAEEKGSDLTEAEKKRLQREWEDLMKETESLMKDMEND